MDAGPPERPPEGRRRDLATRLAELPSRLLLTVVATGVKAGLLLGAASVWLAARFGPSRRR